jgi:hypothetical protein
MMKRNFVLLSALCIAILGLATIVSAQDAQVAGTWTLSLNMGGGGGQGGGGGRGGPQTLTLTQDGQKLTGTLHGGRGDSPVTGTITGNNITFSVSRTNQNGDTVKTDYTGTVSADSMKGTVSMRGNSVDWTATKGAPSGN